MINHVRTLLLNRSVGASVDYNVLGAEYVPPEFRPVELTTPLQALRRLLFGADPDWYMLNYRLQQLLTVVHASELADYVTFLDPRITYDLQQNQDFGSSETFRPVVTAITSSDELFIVGSPARPDTAGRMLHEFEVEVTDADTVRTRELAPSLSSVSTDVTFTEGLSDAVPLGKTGYSYRIRTGTGQKWTVRVLLRPSFDLGQLVVAAESLGERTFYELWGTAPEEPFKTFRNLWELREELPYRLGGLTLGLAYRTEAIRRGTRA